MQATQMSARMTEKMTGKILLVEDEPSLRRGADVYLTLRGHQVLVAGSGEEAIKLWDHYGDAIELLIADVKMPGLSGTYLAALLTELKPRLKVIFQTAHVNDAVANVLAKNENVRLLEKPYVLEDLAQIVEALLGSGCAAAG